MSRTSPVRDPRLALPPAIRWSLATALAVLLVGVSLLFSPVLGGAGSHAPPTAGRADTPAIPSPSPSPGLVFPGIVWRTLDLYNNTVYVGNHVGLNPFYPISLTPDLARGRLYVSGFQSGTIAEFNLTTQRTVASIALGAGSEPVGMALDPATGDLYVAEWGSGQLAIVSTVTDRLLRNLTGFYLADDATYDPSNGDVYVDWQQYNSTSGQFDGKVSAFDPTRGVVVANLTVGMDPEGMAYDPATGDVYVASAGSFNVTGIAATNRIAGTIPTGSQVTTWLAVDPLNGTLYASTLSMQLEVLSPALPGVLGSIPLPGYPGFSAFAGGSSRLVVPLGDSNRAVVIEAGNGSIVAGFPAGLDAVAAAPVAPSDLVDVLASDSDNLTELATASPAFRGSAVIGALPVALVYDNASGRVYLSNWANAELSSIPFDSYRVDENSSDGLLGYSLAYVPPDGRVYLLDQYTLELGAFDAASGAAGTVLPLSPGTVGSGVPFLASDPQPLTYVAPNGTLFLPWSQHPWPIDALNLSTGVGRPFLNFSYPQGTLYLPSTGDLYVTAGVPSALGIVDLRGNGSVRWVPMPGGGSMSGNAIAYAPAQQELYVTSYWSDRVAVFNLTQGRFVGTDPVGVEPAGIAYDPTSGDLFITNFGSDNVTVIDPAFPVGGAQIVTSVPVGVEPEAIVYDDSDAMLYVANFGSGTISVIATSNFPIVHDYSVSFTETGLPTGTTWGVTFAGQNQTAATGPFQFVEPNGVYAFTVSIPAGYSAAPSSGSVTVAGSNLSSHVVFTAVPPGPGGGGSSGGSGGGTGGELLGVLGAIVAIALAVVFLRRRRRGRPVSGPKDRDPTAAPGR